MATYSENVTQKIDAAVILSGGLNSGAGIGQFANQILCTAPANGKLEVQIAKILTPNYSDQMALEIYGPGGTVELLKIPDLAAPGVQETHYRGDASVVGRVLQTNIIVPAGHSLRWQARRSNATIYAQGNIQGSGQGFTNTP